MKVQKLKWNGAKYWQDCTFVQVSPERVEVWEVRSAEEPNLLIACSTSLFSKLHDLGLCKP